MQISESVVDLDCIMSDTNQPTTSANRKRPNVEIGECSNGNSSDDGGKRRNTWDYCNNCCARFSTQQELKKHIRSCRPLNIPPIERIVDGCVCRELYESALNGTARSIRFTPVNRGASAEAVNVMPLDFIEQARPLMESTLVELRESGTEMRVHIVLTIRMRQIDFATDKTIMEDDIVFSSPMFDIGDDIDFNNAIALLLAKIESFTERGSNWIVVGIEKIDFRLIAYR